jgi:hypothetical protein
MRTKALTSCLFLIACIAGAETRTATVQDPRPLAEAIDFLERVYNIPITYEDPPYVHASEVADVTAQVTRSSMGRRILVPRGGSLSFAYEVTDAPPTKDAARLAASAALGSLLASYQTAGGGARFTLIPESILLHVVPAQFTDQFGHLQNLKPILDTSVSLPAEERTAAKLVNDVCDALSRRWGLIVTPGNVPYGLLASHKTTLSVSDKTARSVLDRLFAEIGTPLSWHLYHDPGLNWYVLNIHLVEPAGKEE